MPPGCPSRFPDVCRYRWRGRQALTLLFESIFLLGAYICTKLSLTIGTQRDLGINAKWWGAIFITLAAGTQNSLTSNYTAIVVRSTHTTGLVVDIGIAIGQMIHTRSTKYMWKLQVWGPVLAGFILGAFFGTLVFNAIGEEALLVAIALILFLALATWMDMAYKELRREDRNFLLFSLKSKVSKEFKEF